MKKLAIHTKMILSAGLLWTVPWAYLVLQDVRERSAIGRGVAGSIDVHEVFELTFVAAHFGVRWVIGVVALAALWGALTLLRRRGTGGRDARGPWQEALAGD